MKQFIFFIALFWGTFSSFYAVAQQPTEAEIKAEMMRIMQSNPEIINDPEAWSKQALKNLGVANPGGIDPIKDAGITNATHEKYVNKVVFANTAISSSSPNESSFKNSFASLSEGIYARMYLSQSFRNELAALGVKTEGGLRYSIRFLKDGKELSIGTEEVSAEEALKATTLSFILAPKAGDKDYKKNNMNATNGFLRAIKDLPAGKHNIKVEIELGSYKGDKIVASGSFDLNINTTDRNAFVKNYEVVFTGEPLRFNSSNSDTGNNGTGGAVMERCENPVIYIDNQTGRTIKVEISKSQSGGSHSTQHQSSGTRSYTLFKGDVIRVDGVNYRTVSDTDHKKTFVIK